MASSECRECRGEGEAAGGADSRECWGEGGGEGREREEPETQGREKVKEGQDDAAADEMPAWMTQKPVAPPSASTTDRGAQCKDCGCASK